MSTKTSEKSKSDLLFLMIVHGLLALLIPTVLFTLVSCMKPLKAEPPELGPQVDKDLIEEALVLALKDVSLATIKTDQNYHFEFNYKIIGLDEVKKILDHYFKILSVEDKPEALVVKIENREEDFTTQPPKVRVYESEDVFKKQNAENTTSTLSTENFLIQQLMRDPMSKETKKPVRYTYHNLTVRKDQEAVPPEDVTKKPNCGNVPNCRIHFTFIEYDEVSWFSDNEYVRVRYQHELTPDTPYYGTVLSSCNIKLYSVYTVRTCQVLRDFTYGN